jgi:hypothetical protein
LNFNVYLDEQSVERLNALAQKRGVTRNGLIREAVGHFLDRKADPAWPDAVMEFNGDPHAPVFESARRSLRPPRKGPLR